MDTNILGILNSLSTISNLGSYGSSGSVYQASSTSFGNILKSQMVNQMKQEIYSQFQIDVGGYGDNFSCYIPSEVLYRMYTDTNLKDKVFGMLEKYSGEEFQHSIMGQEASGNKYTLTFDEKGDMTMTLKTGTEKQNKTDQTTALLYQKLLMQQAALMPYRMNLNTGYNSLYGLNSLNTGYNSLYGLNGLNTRYSSLYGLNGLSTGYSSLYGLNTLNSMQNSLFSSILGSL